MKFSENLNNFHGSVYLSCNDLHPVRLDGLKFYNYITKHCKRLVLRLILACLIKSTLIRSKTLKSSNTRL
nr:MAG TPA: hypothetical protein [Bacteriophage sp.]